MHSNQSTFSLCSINTPCIGDIFGPDGLQYLPPVRDHQFIPPRGFELLSYLIHGCDEYWKELFMQRCTEMIEAWLMKPSESAILQNRPMCFDCSVRLNDGVMIQMRRPCPKLPLIKFVPILLQILPSIPFPQQHTFIMHFFCLPHPNCMC